MLHKEATPDVGTAPTNIRLTVGPVRLLGHLDYKYPQLRGRSVDGHRTRKISILKGW
jgi:hypothetical protein